MIQWGLEIQTPQTECHSESKLFLFGFGMVWIWNGLVLEWLLIAIAMEPTITNIKSTCKLNCAKLKQAMYVIADDSS